MSKNQRNWSLYIFFIFLVVSACWFFSPKIKEALSSVNFKKAPEPVGTINVLKAEKARRLINQKCGVGRIPNLSNMYSLEYENFVPFKQQFNDEKVLFGTEFRCFYRPQQGRPFQSNPVVLEVYALVHVTSTEPMLKFGLCKGALILHDINQPKIEDKTHIREQYDFESIWMLPYELQKMQLHSDLGGAINYVFKNAVEEGHVDFDKTGRVYVPVQEMRSEK